jgi:hypothetical protein
MRGKRSVFFIFKQYLQHSLFFTAADKGAARYIAILAALGGIEAMPLAKDFMGMISLAMSQFGDKHFSTDEWFRELFRNMDADPNFPMYGALGSPLQTELFGGVNFGLPVDIGSRISQGSVIPGFEAFKDYATGDQSAEEGVGITLLDAAGPVAQVPLGILEFLGSDDPNKLKAIEKALPRAARNIAKAYRYAFSRDAGKETDKGGATIVDFEDETYLTALKAAVGFALAEPKRVYEKRKLPRQHDRWIAAKFSGFVKALVDAKEHGDIKEEMRIKREIDEWNESDVVKEDRAYYINKGKLDKAIREKRRNIARREAGYARTQRQRFIQERTDQLFEHPLAPTE